LPEIIRFATIFLFAKSASISLASLLSVIEAANSDLYYVFLGLIPNLILFLRITEPSEGISEVLELALL
jgi:hypothetical protein